MSKRLETLLATDLASGEALTQEVGEFVELAVHRGKTNGLPKVAMIRALLAAGEVLAGQVEAEAGIGRKH